MLQVIQYILSPLEKLINSQKITLTDCEVKICLQDINLDIFLICQNNYINLTTSSTQTPNVVITTTVTKLIKLATSSNPKLNDIYITGDVELIQNLQELLKINWKEKLTNMFGDIPAHILKTGSKQLNFITQNLLDMGREYLTYETDLLPTKQEYDNLTSQIQELNSRTEQLEAKLKELL